MKWKFPHEELPELPDHPTTEVDNVNYSDGDESVAYFDSKELLIETHSGDFYVALYSKSILVNGKSYCFWIEKNESLPTFNTDEVKRWCLIE